MGIGFTSVKRKPRRLLLISFCMGKLTWWAIGASLIASNISAEQMSV
jgi:hypothetical protein